MKVEIAFGWRFVSGSSRKRLARTWLALKNENSIFLAADAGLTADLATSAINAGKALTGSVVGAKLEGYAAGNDPPLVNLAEGGVLLEMKEAMRLFGEANARHPAVKKLTSRPGDSKRARTSRSEEGRSAGPEARRAVRTAAFRVG